jgi:hypothetical protein
MSFYTVLRSYPNGSPSGARALMAAPTVEAAINQGMRTGEAFDVHNEAGAVVWSWEARDSGLTVVRQAHEGDRALGFAEATHRTTGIMAGGWGENLEYLRGVETVLAKTLDRVREAISHVEAVRLTADTITDEQICELRAVAHGSHFTNRNDAMIELCDLARGWSCTETDENPAKIREARARCAEMLNARNGGKRS